MLTAFVDYAGLFPPAQLGIAQALTEYSAARRSPQARMLGRFIVRLSQMDALIAAVPEDEPLALSVILDTGIAGVEQADALRREIANVLIEALEVPLATSEIPAFAAALRSRPALSRLPVYVEAPAEALSAIAGCGLRGKVRCGGATPQAYPSPQTLARYIHTAAKLGVAFKATAGLHHPVRHDNAAAGVKMHGFLNLIAACVAAQRGADEEHLADVIATEDAAAFVPVVFTVEEMRDVRARLFTSYGSCSFAEPVDDLRALGVL